MWKSWYELTREQKEEVRTNADTEVRLHLSEYVYLVDDEGRVLEFEHLYQKGH